jgi:hypothetical protein
MNMNASRQTLVAIAAAATLGATGLAPTQASPMTTAGYGYGYGSYGRYSYNSYPSYGYGYSYPSYGYCYSHPSYGYGYGHRHYGYRSW